MTAVACVIPALDAADTVAGVVCGIRTVMPAVLTIVVDDGSRDATHEVAASCAHRALRFPRNRGKGAALRAGFAAAVECGASIILTLDADGQHDPACAPRLVAALRSADLVIGTRERHGARMPLRRRVSNAVSAAAVSACIGRRLRDSQSGYRAMRAEALARVPARGDRYEYETDFLITAARVGLRIACVPVPTIYGAASHFRELRDSVRVVWTIGRHMADAAGWLAARPLGAGRPAAVK